MKNFQLVFPAKWLFSNCLSTLTLQKLGFDLFKSEFRKGSSTYLGWRQNDIPVNVHVVSTLQLTCTSTIKVQLGIILQTTQLDL